MRRNTRASTWKVPFSPGTPIFRPRRSSAFFTGELVPTTSATSDGCGVASQAATATRSIPASAASSRVVGGIWPICAVPDTRTAGIVAPLPGTMVTSRPWRANRPRSRAMNTGNASAMATPV